MSPSVPALSAPPCTLGLAELPSPIYATDAEWFEAEVLPHERALRAYFRMKFPHLAEPDDLIQETFFRILKARAAGKTIMNKSFFFTVARHLAYDLCRRRSFVQFDTLGDRADSLVMEDVPNAAEAAAHANELTVLAAAVAAAIATLPERCREVTRRKLAGESHRQITADLGISVKTSMNHVNLGLAKLREYLLAHGISLRGPR